MREILNSPWFVVAFILCWLAVIRFMKRRSKMTCSECGGRRFEEAGKEAVGLVHSDNQFTAKTGVNMSVTYRCLDCRARTTVQEFRD